MKRLIVGLLFLSMVGVASADDHWQTCGTLFEDWKSYKKIAEDKDNRTTRDLWQGSEFRGYIHGWVDRDTSIKLPKGFGYKQVSYVVGKWLENHPELWHKHSADCVYKALKEAYGLK